MQQQDYNGEVAMFASCSLLACQVTVIIVIHMTTLFLSYKISINKLPLTHISIASYAV